MQVWKLEVWWWHCQDRDFWRMFVEQLHFVLWGMLIDKKSHSSSIDSIKWKMRNNCVIDFITVQRTSTQFCSSVKKRPVYRVIPKERPEGLERGSLSEMFRKVCFKKKGWTSGTKCWIEMITWTWKKFIILDTRDGAENTWQIRKKEMILNVDKNFRCYLLQKNILKWDIFENKMNKLLIERCLNIWPYILWYILWIHIVWIHIVSTTRIFDIVQNKT